MAPKIAAVVVDLAAESRDSHLTLRRVERQQRLVELLAGVRQPCRVRLSRANSEWACARWNETSPGCGSRAYQSSRFLVHTEAADCLGTPRRIRCR
jgi:hypothetical protein